MMVHQKTGHGLVDGTLDSARIVVDHHPEHPEGVQNIQPGNDLLQRSSGDTPHEYALRQASLESRDGDAGRAGDEVETTGFERNKNRLPALRGKSLLEALAVPAGIVGKDGNAAIQLRGVAERLIQQRRIQFATGKAFAGLHRSHGDSRRAEQHGIDLVEIHIDGLEHVGERAAVIA